MRSARRGIGAAAVLAVAALAVAVWLRPRGETEPDGTPERGAGTASPDGARPGLEGRPAAPVPTAPPAPAEPAAAAAPRGAWRVEGRVLDAAGAAVPGATVDAFLSLGVERRAIPSTTSGSEGAFVLDLADARALGPLSLAGATLYGFAWGEGHAPSEAAVHDAWPAAAAFEALVVRWTFVLREGDVLHGRVVRGDGTPVDAATVVACAEKVHGVGTTHPDGRYALARPDAGTWSLVAFAPEHGTGRVPVPSRESRELPDIVLRPTAGVEGRVVYADGAPVADVAVAAEAVEGSDSEEPDPCLAGWFQGQTRSRADGRFRVLVPRAGPCRVWTPDASSEARCRSGDRDVRLVVAGHRVRVRVIDARGMRVPGLGYSTITWDPQHANRLDDLLEGRHDLDRARREADEFEAGSSIGAGDFFLAPGAAWVFVARASGSHPLEATLRVPATGNETEVRLEAKPVVPEGALRLTALDPNGATLSLLYVRASTPLGSDLWRGVLPEDCVVPGLPAGPVRLDLRPIRDRKDEGWVPPPGEWLLPTTALVAVAAGPPTEATLRVPWGGRVRLVLRSPPGTEPGAAGEYSVRLTPAAGGDSILPMTYPEDPSGKPPTRMSSHFVADRPVITAEAVPAGDYRLDVWREGAGRGTPAVSGAIRVLAHQTVDLVLDLKRE